MNKWKIFINESIILTVSKTLLPNEKLLTNNNFSCEIVSKIVCCRCITISVHFGQVKLQQQFVYVPIAGLFYTCKHLCLQNWVKNITTFVLYKLGSVSQVKVILTISKALNNFNFSLYSSLVSIISCIGHSFQVQRDIFNVFIHSNIMLMYASVNYLNEYVLFRLSFLLLMIKL